ncbi:MAG: hypothetical protein JRI23_11835 [Deltaproteobacteria bacterium]|jgi:hypothetical protein|nr:hypothetical protein [Deltaproteobacteria bacterium]MBW2532398.1 hypothetical protein [Deltaproteobacteria bacterium]
MSTAELVFEPTGPFDGEERALIEEVVAAVHRVGTPQAEGLLDAVGHNLQLLNRLGAILNEYPSLYAPQELGQRKQSLQTLVAVLCQSDLSNFDMFLPTRALLARTLAEAEVNFYRLLRHVVAEALPEKQERQLRAGIDKLLCECLYARLASLVLKHIASDETVSRATREKAVMALSLMWESTTYRVKDFFPVLEATWEARRTVPVTLGTLMGTSEMFRLLAAGCDSRFVDLLVKPGHSENEAAAFREFLFGSTTEKLRQLEEAMAASGKHTVSRADVAPTDVTPDLSSPGTDPALAMYQFFRSRHLQAAARRLNDLPGPKRTAEEYVMLRYLQQLPAEELRPPSAA